MANTKKTEDATPQDGGQAALQARYDDAVAQGFHGVKADPEPNESYTVAGVTGGTAKAPKSSAANA